MLDAEGQPKQIEYNTMAASFAAVSQQVSKWHKHALERHQELLEPHMAWMGEIERAIPTNDVVPKLAGPDGSITASLVIVFGGAHRNLFSDGYLLSVN